MSHRICLYIILFLSLLLSNNKDGIDNKKNNIESYQDSIDSVIKNLLLDVNKVSDFTLKSHKGETYNMRSLEGHVVLINFWATWCAPCRMEIPELNEIQKQYKEDNFIVLGISISDTEKALIDFAKLYNVDYPLLFGTSKEIEKILVDYGGVYSVPTSILVNKKGEITFKYPGAILESYDIYDGVFSTLNNKIVEALNEKNKF